MSTAYNILCLGHSFDQAPGLLRLAVAGSARGAEIDLLMQQPPEGSSGMLEPMHNGLRALVEARYPRDVRVSAWVEQPLSARAITNRAAQAGYDLLIKASSNDHEPGLWLIDEDAQLLRSVQSDLWFAGVAPPTRTRRVVAAIAALPDGAYTQRSTARLDKRVLKRAARLAYRMGAGLHAVSAWHLVEGPGYEKPIDGVSVHFNDRLAALRQRLATEHEQRIHRLVAHVLGNMPQRIGRQLQLTIHQQEGLPAEIINGQLDPRAADILVIGQGARRRIHDFLGRSLADTLRLSHAGTTLVVKSATHGMIGV